MGASGAEHSNYSSVYLPWGPQWDAAKIAKQTRKKDAIVNRLEFLANGRVVKNSRPYKLHLCAVEEVCLSV